MKKKLNLESTSQSEILINRSTRRMFIQTSSGLFALPFLSSLIPLDVLAQTVAPRRSINISAANQMPYNLFFPHGYNGNTYPTAVTNQTQFITEGNYRYAQTNLINYISTNGSISNMFDSKFNNYVNRMVLLGGLDVPGRLDHGLPVAMGNVAASHLGSNGGFNANYTIDRVLVRQKQIYANATDSAPGLGLRLGDDTNSCESTGAVRGLGAGTMGRSFNGNLSQIFNAYFKVNTGTTVVTSPSTTTTQTVETKSTRRKLVDMLYSSAMSVRNSNKTGVEDKKRIDEYLQSVAEIQKNIPNTTTTTTTIVPGTNASSPILNCSPVANTFRSDLPTQSDLGVTGNAVQSTSEYYSQMVKLISLFIKCDICRVFNVGMASTIANNVAINQNSSPRPWHLEHAHGNNFGVLTAGHKWIFDTILYQLLRELDVAEGSEKYIDNTLIYYSPEMSFGHSGINMGGVLIGDKRLNGGRAINYADYTKGTSGYAGLPPGLVLGPGQPINRLWITMMQLMGIPTTSYFGKYGNMSNTFGNWKDNYPGGWESVFESINRSQYISNALPGVLK